MPDTTRYEVIKKLGEGGMGVVYEAIDHVRNMRVALKTLRKVDPNHLYRFKREFRALSDLSHPNIIALYDLVAENDEWFLAMELIEGDDFTGYVRRPNAEDIAAINTSQSGTSMSTPSDVTVETRVVAPPSTTHSNLGGGMQFMHSVPEEPASVDELVDIDRLLDALSQLAQALYALHTQGIIHRDLKPSNVRVTRDGRVVLMDFGIVSESTSKGDSQTPVMGTPAYMAPEQITETEPNPSVDWYAFGVLIYQALTCRLPFRAPRSQILEAKQRFDPLPPSTYAAGIPEKLETLCMRLLARDPHERPQGYDVLTELGVAAESISYMMSEATFIGINEFVGRANLLQELDDAYQQCLGNGAVCVVAEGPSGMGKTTLLRRFVSELEATQFGGYSPMFLAGRCHERESLSYKAFDGVIDQLSRDLLEQPDHVVNSLLPDDISYLARVFPVLKRIAGVHASRSHIHGSLDQQRERAIQSLRTLLVNLGQWRPVVIRIEDLQWADRDSLELLVAIMRPPLPRRLFVMTSLRSDVALDADNILEQTLEQLAEHVVCYRIPVGPLSYIEQSLLVAKLVGQRNLSAHIGDAYWEEAEGNPLLLTELARYAAEAPEALGDITHPTLGDIIARRIARLPDKARALIEILAIAGEPTPLSLLADCIDLSDDERERASSTLRVAKLARIALPGHEPWLNAQHDKICDTVISQLSEDRRRELHRTLARAMQRWDAAAVPSLARHWLAAGEREQAVEYLLSSAQAATDKLAFDRAAELYRALLEVAADVPGSRILAIHKRLANVLVLSGRYGEAADVYAQAARHASRDEALELSRLGAENLLRSGRIDDGIEHLEQLMNQLGVPLKRSRSGKLMKLAMHRAKRALRGIRYTPRSERDIPARDLGRIDTLYVAATSLAMLDHRLGATVQAQHLESALQAGEESRICRALAVEVGYLGVLGGKYGARAVELARDVERRAEAIGDPRLLALHQLGVGVTAFYGQRMGAATEAFERALHLFEQVVGAQWEETTVRYFLCLSRLHTGDWRGYMNDLASVIERAERRNDAYALNLFKTAPSTWYWLARDQADRAQNLAESALDGWSERSYYLAHHHAHLAHAIGHLYQGDGERAGQLLDRIFDQLDHLMMNEMPLVVAQLVSYRGRAALLVDDPSIVRKCIKRLGKIDTPLAPALARLLEASLVIRESNDTAKCERMVAEAMDDFAEHGAAHMVAACSYRLGKLMGGPRRDEYVARAMSWMREHEIEAPEAMVALLTWQLDR